MANRTKVEMNALEDAILYVLEQDYPQSVRHIFYRLVDGSLAVYVEKTEAGYRRIMRRCSLMREENRLPWHYIVDLSRHAFHYSGFDGINDDFIASAAALYRRNYWTTTDFYVEVWAESRSIASVLQGECRRAGVDLYPASGFSSSTFVHDAAEEIVEAEKQNCVILYIGDYDPAGALIDLDIESKMRKYLDAMGWQGDLLFDRVAINAEQIADHNLPTKPRKASEKRRPDIMYTVEAETLPAGILRGLVRERIERLMPSNVLLILKEAERIERKDIAARLRGPFA